MDHHDSCDPHAAAAESSEFSRKPAAATDAAAAGSSAAGSAKPAWAVFGSSFGGSFKDSLSATPVNLSAHRRTSVSAEALNPHAFNDNWSPPVHSVSAEQMARLNATIVRNFLFQHLDQDALRTIIFALEEKHFPKGTSIITQGDEGDFFYVVETGSVDYVVNDQKVNTSGPGSSFGELALMYNSPRAATVLANEDCTCWALDRVTFRRILLDGTAKRRSLYEKFLKEVPILQSLSNYERSKLADALHSQTFKAGADVVVEGDKGENFYFIENGQADVIKGDKIVAHLTKGDYFGELALLYDSPRQATVRAASNSDNDLLKVVCLNKNGFQRLLGPAVDILKVNDPTKEESH